MTDRLYKECTTAMIKCKEGCTSSNDRENLACRRRCSYTFRYCELDMVDDCLSSAKWICDLNCNYLERREETECFKKYTNDWDINAGSLFAYRGKEAFDSCMEPILKTRRDCVAGIDAICCGDGMKNNGEKGIDCGGGCSRECTKAPKTTQTLRITTTSTLKGESCGDGRCEGLVESCYSCPGDCVCGGGSTCIRDLPSNLKASDLKIDWMGCSTVKAKHSQIMDKQPCLQFPQSEIDEDVRVYYKTSQGPDGKWYFLYVYQWDYSDVWIDPDGLMGLDHSWDYEPVIVVMDENMNYEQTIYEKGHYRVGTTKVNRLEVLEGTHGYSIFGKECNRRFQEMDELDTSRLYDMNRQLEDTLLLPSMVPVDGSTGKVLSLDEAYWEPWNVENSGSFTRRGAVGNRILPFKDLTTTIKRVGWGTVTLPFNAIYKAGKGLINKIL